MTKKVLIIVIVVSIIFASINFMRAYFSSGAVLSGINLRAGSPDLKISSDGENFTKNLDLADNPWLIKDEETIALDFFLKNESSVNAPMIIEVTPQDSSGEIDEQNVMISFRSNVNGNWFESETVTFANLTNNSYQFPEPLKAGKIQRYQILISTNELSISCSSCTFRFGLKINGIVQP